MTDTAKTHGDPVSHVIHVDKHRYSSGKMQKSRYTLADSRMHIHRHIMLADIQSEDIPSIENIYRESLDP